MHRITFVPLQVFLLEYRLAHTGRHPSLLLVAYSTQASPLTITPTIFSSLPSGFPKIAKLGVEIQSRVLFRLVKTVRRCDSSFTVSHAKSTLLHSHGVQWKERIPRPGCTALPHRSARASGRLRSAINGARGDHLPAGLDPTWGKLYVIVSPLQEGDLFALLEVSC